MKPPNAPSLFVFKLPLLHEPLLRLRPLLHPGRRGHLSPGSCASYCLPRPLEVWLYVYVYVYVIGVPSLSLARCSSAWWLALATLPF